MYITNIIAWLLALVPGSAPDDSHCYRHSGALVVHCEGYRAPRMSSDPLLAAAGRELMLGPWADADRDLVVPLLLGLIGERPVVTNVMVNGGIVIDRGGALVDHVAVEVNQPADYALSLTGKGESGSFTISNSKFVGKQ